MSRRGPFDDAAAHHVSAARYAALYSTYQILTSIGVINTYAALILTYPTFLMPFATWVMLGYFRSIPIELEEAAMIDGASRFYVF